MILYAASWDYVLFEARRFASLIPRLNTNCQVYLQISHILVGGRVIYNSYTLVSQFSVS